MSLNVTADCIETNQQFKKSPTAQREISSKIMN
jgi:hypothetical protein